MMSLPAGSGLDRKLRDEARELRLYTEMASQERLSGHMGGKIEG